MRVAVPKETAPGERRVALVPEVVRKLAAAGWEVVVEPGAGASARIADALYEEAGAALQADPWDADVVVKVAPPSVDEIERLRPDGVLVGFLQPLSAGPVV